VQDQEQPELAVPRVSVNLRDATLSDYQMRLLRSKLKIGLDNLVHVDLPYQHVGLIDNGKLRELLIEQDAGQVIHAGIGSDRARVFFHYLPDGSTTDIDMPEQVRTRNLGNESLNGKQQLGYREHANNPEEVPLLIHHVNVSGSSIPHDFLQQVREASGPMVLGLSTTSSQTSCTVRALSILRLSII
jgi:hypothetical protein